MLSHFRNLLSFYCQLHDFSFASRVVSEEELLNLAEDLRPHTAQSMKMEPAPWIKEYMVDMEELYTELTLEKIDQKLVMEERRKLENYKDLFASLKPGMLEYLDIRYYYPNLIPKTKILVKGGPGMGKTSLVKKNPLGLGKEALCQCVHCVLCFSQVGKTR